MHSKKNVKNKNLELHYCGSGFSLTFRLSHKGLQKGVFKNLVTSSQYLKDRLDGHVKICGLCNPYTEEKIINSVVESGLEFRSLFPDGLFSDSGGLQAMSSDGTIDHETKQKIYFMQSQHSDYAMSVDLLPYKVRGNKKIYLGDKICGEYGHEAGQNLKEQIKSFKKNKSKTKIIPIIQGKNDGLELYAQNLLKNIKKKDLKRLECFAIGGVIWAHEFEILERSISLYEMNCIPPQLRRHYHLLGVTGYSRLLPTLIGAKSGLLPNIKRLSFDSTKILKSYHFGTVYPSFKDLKSGIRERKMGKVRNVETEKYYEEIWNWWKNNPHNIFESADDLIENSLYNSKNLKTETQQFEKGGVEHGVKAVTQTMVFIYYNTFKFLQILEMYLKGELRLRDFMPNYKHLQLLQTLETIDNVTDFHHWYNRSVRHKVNDSKKIRFPQNRKNPDRFLF